MHSFTFACSAALRAFASLEIAASRFPCSTRFGFFTFSTVVVLVSSSIILFYKKCLTLKIYY